jgi:mannose-6-phosphate isomerase-like protein (cupin superfamily)
VPNSVFDKYHRRPEGPGLLFSEDLTCGALRAEVIGGRGGVEMDGRSLTLLLMDGAGTVLEEKLFVGDMLFVPAGRTGRLGYELTGRALLVRYAPSGDEAEPLRGHAVIRLGQALGYVRTQYRGSTHGWGAEVCSFNPQGLTYTDKLWGISRDVLSQELVVPPGHRVPVHQHGELGREPSGEDYWQLCYFWEGSARVDLGSSPGDIGSLDVRAESAVLYPNGVAHTVEAGPAGCRYVYFERRKPGGAVHLQFDSERDYERSLTLRAGMSLEDFLRAGRARTV